MYLIDLLLRLASFLRVLGVCSVNAVFFSSSVHLKALHFQGVGGIFGTGRCWKLGSCAGELISMS